MTNRVRVVQLGRGVLNLETAPDMTLGDALSAHHIPTVGMEVRVNSESTSLDAHLQDGDLVTVVPLIRGGTDRHFGDT